MTPHGHAHADSRNLHLHRVAFDKLRQYPELLEPVVDLIGRWLADGLHEPSRHWLGKWREMLTTWPLERVVEVVLDAEHGQELRQCSPLAPVLTPQERWAALDELRRSLDGVAPTSRTGQ
jgi:hypothetical protein